MDISFKHYLELLLGLALERDLEAVRSLNSFAEVSFLFLLLFSLLLSLLLFFLSVLKASFDPLIKVFKGNPEASMFLL